MSDRIIIPVEEMNFFNLISIDEVGEVFEWNNRIFRGITAEAKPLVDSYFYSGFIEEIVSKGYFPKTELSNYYNPRYCYILEHEKIRLQTIDSEWSFDMLKDAAILVSEIAAIAWRYGFNMKDCHTKNVLFHNNKPIYVDLGSFIKKEEGTSGFKSYEQIMGYYYYVLKLWADGCISLPKQLQALYKFEKRDYLLYKYPLWRHFVGLLDKYVSMESKLIFLTYTDKSNNKIINSKLLLFLWKIANNFKLFKWQKPESFAKMFINMKSLGGQNVMRKYGQDFVIDQNCREILSETNKTIIINPGHYNFLDAFLNEFSQKEIVAIDINEREGNSNYLKYKKGPYNLTNLTFNIFYPTFHYNYQTAPTHRYRADTFIIVDPTFLAYELRKPSFVLFRVLLQYSFERLIVVEEKAKSMDEASRGYINMWYQEQRALSNGCYIVSEYIKKDDNGKFVK